MGSYEVAAMQNGELRIYLETATPIDVAAIQSQLGYRFATGRSRHNPADPWDSTFGDPRVIASEAEFISERDRIVAIFSRQLSEAWEVEILYHPANRGSAIYHWSSTGLGDRPNSSTI